MKDRLKNVMCLQKSFSLHETTLLLRAKQGMTQGAMYLGVFVCVYF